MTRDKDTKQSSLADDGQAKAPGGEVAQGAGSFEEAMAQLEGVVTDLESGEVSLDDAIALFEKGLALVKSCRSTLERAEQRVEELLADGSTHDLEK